LPPHIRRLSLSGELIRPSRRLLNDGFADDEAAMMHESAERRCPRSGAWARSDPGVGFGGRLRSA
jgi:hypothetical protein